MENQEKSYLKEIQALWETGNCAQEKEEDKNESKQKERQTKVGNIEEKEC